MVQVWKLHVLVSKARAQPTKVAGHGAPVKVPDAMTLQLLPSQWIGGPEVAQQPSHTLARNFPDPEEAQNVVYSVGVEVPA